MYKDIDRYAFPNKWVEQDFEKLQILVEKAQKERNKKEKADDKRKRSESSN